MKDWENDDKGIKNNDNDHINHKNDGFKRGGKCKKTNAVQQNEQNTIHDTRRKRTQYNITQHNSIQHNAIQYNTIQNNTIQCNAIKYNKIQYNTIQYKTTQYNAIQ